MRIHCIFLNDNVMDKKILKNCILCSIILSSFFHHAHPLLLALFVRRNWLPIIPFIIRTPRFFLSGDRVVSAICFRQKPTNIFHCKWVTIGQFSWKSFSHLNIVKCLFCKTSLYTAIVIIEFQRIISPLEWRTWWCILFRS